MTARWLTSVPTVELQVLWERHVEDESGFDTRLLMLELRAAVRDLGREVAQLRASTAQQPCRRCSDTTVRLADQADYRNSCQVDRQVTNLR